MERAAGAVVRAKLIGTINSSHVFVVLLSTIWLFHFLDFAVFLSPLFQNRWSEWVDVRGQNVHISFVMPFGEQQVSFLRMKGFSSTLEFCTGTWRQSFPVNSHS